MIIRNDRDFVCSNVQFHHLMYLLFYSFERFPRRYKSFHSFVQVAWKKILKFRHIFGRKSVPTQETGRWSRRHKKIVSFLINLTSTKWKNLVLFRDSKNEKLNCSRKKNGLTSKELLTPHLQQNNKKKVFPNKLSKKKKIKNKQKMFSGI